MEKFSIVFSVHWVDTWTHWHCLVQKRNGNAQRNAWCWRAQIRTCWRNNLCHSWMVLLFCMVDQFLPTNLDEFPPEEVPLETRLSWSYNRTVLLDFHSITNCTILLASSATLWGFQIATRPNTPPPQNRLSIWPSFLTRLSRDNMQRRMMGKRIWFESMTLYLHSMLLQPLLLPYSRSSSMMFAVLSGHNSYYNFFQRGTQKVSKSAGVLSTAGVISIAVVSILALTRVVQW